MQFHHHGYVSQEPRRQPAAGTGLDRPDELPDEMDVLIIGSGPAGMLLAAQMSQYPTINTRLIERRGGRLVLVGRDHWTRDVPVWPAVQALAHGRDMAGAIHLVDELDEAAAVVMG